MKRQMNKSQIDALVFDFDGVLTDNTVFVSSEGVELVKCSRSDGLAFEALKKLKIHSLILSTEKNEVVRARAMKLNVEVINGTSNKLKTLEEYCVNNNLLLDRVCFIGNDINDYEVMMGCGYALCPIDAHPMIREISDVVLSSRGGDAVVREVVENILNIEIYETLYQN